MMFADIFRSREVQQRNKVVVVVVEEEMVKDRETGIINIRVHDIRN